MSAPFEPPPVPIPTQAQPDAQQLGAHQPEPQYPGPQYPNAMPTPMASSSPGYSRPAPSTATRAGAWMAAAACLLQMLAGIALGAILPSRRGALAPLFGGASLDSFRAWFLLSFVALLVLAIGLAVVSWTQRSAPLRAAGTVTAVLSLAMAIYHLIMGTQVQDIFFRVRLFGTRLRGETMRTLIVQVPIVLIILLAAALLATAIVLARLLNTVGKVFAIVTAIVWGFVLIMELVFLVATNSTATWGTWYQAMGLALVLQAITFVFLAVQSGPRTASGPTMTAPAPYPG